MSPEPAPSPSEDGTAAPFPAGVALPPAALTELPPDMAFAVWQVLRSVTLWAGEPERRRAGMFDPDYMQEWERRLLTAPFDPEARFPLAVVVGELAGPNPGAGRLSWACVCVADWALGRGAIRAALAFAEAAARATPEHPRYAWLVGRLMRRHGDPRGGERWLKRALKLAVAQRDWEAQARALTGLGNLCVETGRYPEARELHTRALRVSRRWRLREQEGMALHDLFIIATEEGNRAEAELHARGALDAYGQSPRRLCKLAHDVAYWWMDDGYYQRALDVFEALLGHFPNPDDRMQVLGNIGRAAGGCGDRAAFDAAWRASDDLDPLLGTRETAATALLELAYGAVSLGDWSLAAGIAQRAADAARQRSEATVLSRASDLLEAVQHPSRAPGLAMARAGSGAGSADRLAAALVASLREPAGEAGALA